MLSNDQQTQFRRDGFLVIESCVSSTSIQALRHAADGIVAEFDIDSHRSVFSTRDRDRGRDRYFFESAEAVHCFLEEDALDQHGRLTRSPELAINKIGHAMHDHVPEFTSFCRQPILGEMLKDLGMQDPVLWQTMYIFKQPRIGGEVRWHQDASYLISSPPSVVGIWIALEDATRRNGCLWMQPGGHRSPLRERFDADAENARGELVTLDDTPWPSEHEAVPLEVNSGSLVLFHDHMPHASAGNSSGHSRHAFTMHCAPLSAKWAAQNWLQRPTLPPFRL